MISRVKLAEAAQAEVVRNIIDHPERWLNDIMDDIEDKEGLLAGILGGEMIDRPMPLGDVVQQLVTTFAKKAGQSAYDCITRHPGIPL